MAGALLAHSAFGSPAAGRSDRRSRRSSSAWVRMTASESLQKIAGEGGGADEIGAGGVAEHVGQILNALLHQLPPDGGGMGPDSSERTKRWATSFSRAARSTRCRCPRGEGIGVHHDPGGGLPAWSLGGQGGAVPLKATRRFSMHNQGAGYAGDLIKAQVGLVLGAVRLGIEKQVGAALASCTSTRWLTI